jgi:hypothetical protein
MRRVIVRLVTQIDFVDGDEASDVAAQTLSDRPSALRANISRIAPCSASCGTSSPSSPSR